MSLPALLCLMGGSLLVFAWVAHRQKADLSVFDDESLRGRERFTARMDALRAAGNRRLIEPAVVVAIGSILAAAVLALTG